MSDDNLTEMPDLNVGDVITVVSVYNEGDRKLTVEEVGAENEPDALVHSTDDEGYLLSGYGTSYSLTKVKGVAGNVERISLVYESRPAGTPVEDIIIEDRGRDGNETKQEAVTDGGRRLDDEHPRWRFEWSNLKNNRRFPL